MPLAKGEEKMQRDLETIRHILRVLESAPGKCDQGLLVYGKPLTETRKLLYHVALLKEAGLIDGQPLGSPGQENPVWIDLDLTWAGHDFLDAVRDPDIWRQTSRALQQAGAFTFALVKALAQAFLQQKLEEQTGIKLEL